MSILWGQLFFPSSGICSTGESAPVSGAHLVKERMPHTAPDTQAQKTVMIIHVIKPGDVFSAIMEKAGLSKKDALYISKKADRVYKLANLKPGSELELYLSAGGTDLQEIDYKVSRQKRVILYNGRVIPLVQVSSKTASSSISRGTFSGAKHAATPVSSVVKTGTEQARSDKKGGSSTKTAGRKKKSSVHEYASVQRKHRERKAESSQDKFLKAPLDRPRVSSSFTHNRVNPITNREEPHLGVDYSAPAGTPVRSIGPGRVLFSGWIEGYGKIIRILHKNGLVSQYAHLSSFAKGLTTQKKVKKGETIGFVGMTGLATGPHLDFRVTYKGEYINPLNLERSIEKIFSKGDTAKTRNASRG
jgi:murein DD-endopeptidase MepM/ murein hydrolase activator NlpD